MNPDNNTLRRALNYAYLICPTPRHTLDNFKSAALQLLNRINNEESEEFHKNNLITFFQDSEYKHKHYINTHDKKDLVIHHEKTASSAVGVIIEVKAPQHKQEMLTVANINKKALQQIVLYYLRERISHKNLQLTHLIVTNTVEWFIFDARVFEHCFADNKNLIKAFQQFENDSLSIHKTSHFYEAIAKPAIETCLNELTYTYINLNNYQHLFANNTDKDADKQLIALCKLLSPAHLLKLSFSNDANSLNKEFYYELLHIMGLEEVIKNGKILIERKQNQRHSGSLIEQVLSLIAGNTDAETLFEQAMSLAITWINRLLFLKLLETQLSSYHDNDPATLFLNNDKITCFADLSYLFFKILAVKIENRPDELIFAHVPYLNSSLFEKTDLEKNTDISHLRRLKLPLFSSTVLKDNHGKQCTGEADLLSYLFAFLDAYNFASEGKEAIAENNKTLISASVLGLIFEKLNGYQDGAFFTPSVITMYMSRETLRLAVVQKFNRAKNWQCQNIDDLKTVLPIYTQAQRQEANAIINSLKICDPAVGSGHFLVSVLNELIVIKRELRILENLFEWNIVVHNDELKITHVQNEEVQFRYYIHSKESLRVQKTLFHEKQTLIENCLFGVDINPNSVKICRLRLWIELLKSAYYIDDKKTQLETLPNIDINIKCGNSLISRFQLSDNLMKHKANIEHYKKLIHDYQLVTEPAQKRAIEQAIHDLRNLFFKGLIADSAAQKRLKELHTQRVKLNHGDIFVKKSDKMLQNIEKEIALLEADNLETNPLYANAFEWRFEFPDVLNDDGDFVGFDVIIGNPPYIDSEAMVKSELNNTRTILSDSLNFTKGNWDIYIAFFEINFSLLNDT